MNAVAAGRRIRKARTTLGLTQKQLAGDRSTVAYISLLESGKRTPSPKMAEYLASMLRIPITEFFEVKAQPKVLTPDEAEVVALVANKLYQNGEVYGQELTQKQWRTLHQMVASFNGVPKASARWLDAVKEAR